MRHCGGDTRLRHLVRRVCNVRSMCVPLSARLEPSGGMDVISVLAHVISAERETDYERILHLNDVH